MERLTASPEQLVGDDNVRFSLLPARIDAVADSILAEGRIIQDLEVEELPEPIGETIYRVKDGHYRLAAAIKLNAEQNLGLVLPINVVQSTDGLTRMKTQLAANLERQDMTPMDRAVAMKKLLDAGVSRGEIRNIFRSVGGRKGKKNQPLSNSSLNMTVSFLDLPKAIQQKIHEGTVGVAAAYELTKVTPEKRQAILDKAEAALKAEQDRLEAEETKFLESERKTEEQQAKAKAEVEALENQKKALAEAEEALKAATAKSVEAYTAAKAGAATDEEKAAKAAALKAAEDEAREAEKAKEKLRKEVEKTEGKVQTAAQHAEERRKRLEAARKEAAKKNPPAKKQVGPGDVKKAAAAAGEGGHVPLKPAEIRRMVEDLALPSGYPKLEAIGKALKACINGELTDKQLVSALLAVTGEKVPGKAAKAK